MYLSHGGGAQSSSNFLTLSAMKARIEAVLLYRRCVYMCVCLYVSVSVCVRVRSIASFKILLCAQYIKLIRTFPRYRWYPAQSPFLLILSSRGKVLYSYQALPLWFFLGIFLSPSLPPYSLLLPPSSPFPFDSCFSLEKDLRWFLLCTLFPDSLRRASGLWCPIHSAV